MLIGIDRDTAELDRRIARRVARMFAAGLVEETRELLAAGLREGRTASRALGYQQVLAALDGAGELTDAAADTVRATRRFVRRQRSWFRRDRRIHWLDGGRPGPARPGPRPAGRGRDRACRRVGPCSSARATAPRTTSCCSRTRTARLELTPARVAALCDRRRGLGADGLLRVVRWAALGADGPAPEPGVEWFMDYRNADGSVAEMCGNGVRVYARYLAERGWLDGRRAARSAPAPGCARCAWTAPRSPSTWARPRIGAASTARLGERAFAGIAVDVGNPHLACVTDAAHRHAGPRPGPPAHDPALFPHGVNVEFVSPVVSERAGPQVRMRVHERGVGETRSCGTGTVAAVVAALRAAGRDTGTVACTPRAGGCGSPSSRAPRVLHGPAVLVASGELCPSWWESLALTRPGISNDTRRR